MIQNYVRGRYFRYFYGPKKTKNRLKQNDRSSHTFSGCEAAQGAACQNDLVSDGNDKSAGGENQAGDSRRGD